VTPYSGKEIGDIQEIGGLRYITVLTGLPRKTSLRTGNEIESWLVSNVGNRGDDFFTLDDFIPQPDADWWMFVPDTLEEAPNQASRHLVFVFRDPSRAMLFKLTWLFNLTWFTI
jgi:hypothetical protein